MAAPTTTSILELDLDPDTMIRPVRGLPGWIGGHRHLMSLQSCFAVVLGGPQETGQLLEEKFDYIFFTGETHSVLQ